MKALILKLVIRYKPVEEGLGVLRLHPHHQHLEITHHQGTENATAVLFEGLIVKEALHLCIVVLIERCHHVDITAAVTPEVAFHLAGEIAVWSGDVTEEVDQEIDMNAAVDVIGAHLHVADVKDPGCHESGVCLPEETVACHQDVTEAYLTGMKISFLIALFHVPFFFTFVYNS
jgi:hypothetical protein